MKKINTHLRKRILITTIAAAIMIGVLITWWALSMHNSSIGDSSQSGTTVKNTSIPDENNTNSNAGQQGANGGSSVAVNPVEQPKTNDPYPIVNEHYKIEQINTTSYSITLYAISNSPSQYDDYISQLKQFKKEALAYLTSRYGDISNFSLTWSPPNAQDL